MTYTLIPKLWYTITPETDCDVATPNGISIHLPAGIQYFHFADSVSIDISGTATVTQNPPLFKPASASALGGGYIESDLNVGHGAADAVAAQCTLTLGDLAAGGALADSNGQRVELEAPHKYAEGSAAFRDAAEACTLTIGEWSKEWEAAPGTRATGWLQLAAGMGTFMVNGLIVSNPEDYTDVEAWNDVLEPCGVYCTDESIESGSPKVNIAAIEYGEAGNAITLEAVGEFYSVSGPTLAGGANGRTSRDVFNDIHDDDDCPVDVTLDADELGLGFTAKEYGVNDAISAVGDMFSNWTGMSGGHGNYSVAELITAISGEFDDITPTAGEAEGTIVLTANSPGAAANAITYTATGCFGSGTVKQGSTTRGKNAVAQTDYEIILNGNQPRPLTPATAMKHGGVYTVAADIDARTVTLVEHATATIVVSAADGPIPNMQLPAWKWCTDNGLQPKLDYFRVYRMEVMDDGFYTSARLVSQYATASEWMYTKWADSYTAYVAGRDVNLVPAETHAIENSMCGCWFNGGTVRKGFASETKALDGSELAFEITRGEVSLICVATLEFSTEKKFKAIALLYQTVQGATTAAGPSHFMFQVWNADTGAWVDACDLVKTAGGNSLEKYIVKIKTDIKSNKWRLVTAEIRTAFSHFRFFEA